jgi:hypothetical protein
VRSSGLHVHCGYQDPEIDRSLRLVLYFDAFLGLPSIIIDKDDKRRTLYGKAGCFRLCKYGVEYRTLSSYFMKDEEHLRWVFIQVNRAIRAYNEGWTLPDGELVQDVINNSKEDVARDLCRRYNLCDNFLGN